MVIPTLSSPQAFEFCEGGTCGEAKASDDKKHVSCPPSDTCGKGGCYCQLFKRPKGSGDDVAWDVPHTDHKNLAKYRPDKMDYKCFCVKPILGGELTADGVKYTVRYQLCGLGSCSLDDVEVHRAHNYKCFAAQRWVARQALVMSSGNVTLHPFNSGAAAMLRACPERAQRVERETSLDISELVTDS